jgi:polyvinyl alcohol dehydrogenase (cytochrome)
MDDGQLLWSQQMTEGDAYNVTCTVPDKAACPDSDGPDFDFGSPPILVRLDAERRALILPQKSGVLHAVDPDQEGRILWQSRVGHGGTLGGIQWGSASDGDRVYVALSDLRYTRARQPDTGAVFTTLNPEEGGGLFAFDVENGELLWNTPPPGCGGRSQCSPAQSAAVSGIPGVVFSGSVDGHLRGYSTDDGDILWDYDTVREFTTVNAVPGKGGSMDGGGAVIADGMLVVGSGYPRFGGLPGNVLLVFSVDGL